MCCEFTFVLAIIIFPILCETKISINIEVASSEKDVKIIYSGHDNKIITEKEKFVFNLTNEKLNKGFRVELGKTPNDIFLKDPTPYDDLFKKYKWQEINRNLKVKKANVIDIINRDVVIKSFEYINNTTRPIQTKIDLHRNVENTVKLAWFENSLPGDEILFDINVDYKYGTYQDENKWRNGSFKSIFLPFGVSKNEFVTIEPGQTIVATLSGFKTILFLQIVYEAKLIGNVIGNYAALYGKYHFWAPSIHNIMKAAEMKNEIETKQHVEIRCYTNPKLMVVDKMTGKIVEPIIMKKKPLMKIFKNKRMKRVLYLQTKKIFDIKKV